MSDVFGVRIPRSVYADCKNLYKTKYLVISVKPSLLQVGCVKEVLNCVTVAFPLLIKESLLLDRVSEIYAILNKNIVKKVDARRLTLAVEAYLPTIKKIVSKPITDSEKLVIRNPLTYFSYKEKEIIRMIQKNNYYACLYVVDVIKEKFDVSGVDKFCPSLKDYIKAVIQKARYEK